MFLKMLRHKDKAFLVKLKLYRLISNVGSKTGIPKRRERGKEFCRGIEVACLGFWLVPNCTRTKTFWTLLSDYKTRFWTYFFFFFLPVAIFLPAKNPREKGDR